MESIDTEVQISLKMTRGKGAISIYFFINYVCIYLLISCLFFPFESEREFVPPAGQMFYKVEGDWRCG